MTTVKDALHQLYDDLESAINLLISAAEARGEAKGREEGGEQMKERIWRGIAAQTYLFPDDIVPPLPSADRDSLGLKEPPCSG